MFHSRPASLVPTFLAVGAGLLAAAPAAQAASGVVKADADLVLIPPVLATLPATKCPKAAAVQINGRTVGSLPTAATGYGSCAIRGLAPVSLRPGTTVLFSATGTGVWPVFALRTVTAAPIATT
jgi:hypothetical protein